MSTKIIYDAKCIEVDSSFFDLVKDDFGPLRNAAHTEEEFTAVDSMIERINARDYHFRHSSGRVEKILVGFDRATCECLNLVPTNEYEQFQSAKWEASSSKCIIRDLKEASIWTRLKWVFTGVK